MKEFIFEVERRVYGWMKDRLSIEAETPEEALKKLKEMAEDGTKNGWDEEMVSNNTSDWETQIDKLIDDEVKSIGMWMWGDVKGYVLEKKVKFVKKYEDESREDEEEEEWEEVDSGWGYYMETDELIEEIMEEHNLKE